MTPAIPLEPLCTAEEIERMRRLGYRLCESRISRGQYVYVREPHILMADRAAPVELPCTWTPVAVRRRHRSLWRPVEGAPCSLAEANELREDGLALMAQRREGEMVVQLVKYVGAS